MIKAAQKTICSLVICIDINRAGRIARRMNSKYCFEHRRSCNSIKAVFHSAKIFARVDILELKILLGKIESISIFHSVKKNKKDIKIALYQQYCKSNYVN